MNIRQIDKKDIPAVALLHKQSFDKTHFTAFFSTELLSRYIKVLIDYNPYSYLAEEGDRILGYLIGGNKTGAALDNFSKNNYLKIILTLLLHPGFILEKIQSVLLKINKVKISEVEYKIYIIASLPEAQGKGIGRALMNTFENELRIKGIKEYGLSVREQNNNAISFYENNNFIRINKIHKSLYYKKIL
ncbi:MAG: GNAT family N-acetyltransferase [Ignavibacteriaceae bacterium]|nr:GNAT family N-acetyltransferase [Ignavibacteriaceae bacterium]